MPPSSSTRAASHARYRGISTTGARKVQASAYPDGGATLSSEDTAERHQGSSCGVLKTSVPARIATPVPASFARLANAEYDAADQASTRSRSRGNAG